MVNALLSAILQALGKRKRRLLDGMEPRLPPEMFLMQRKHILRELGKDEFEKDLAEIIKQYAERQGKGSEQTHSEPRAGIHLHERRCHHE